jgi:hypothetical protein
MVGNQDKDLWSTVLLNANCVISIPSPYGDKLASPAMGRLHAFQFWNFDEYQPMDKGEVDTCL